MSFFSDLFKGDFSNLGTDLEHAPESLAKHPSELYETLGGAAALATGGLGLGLLGGEAGLGAAAGGTSVLGGDAAIAGGDALAAGAAPELPAAVDAASVGGSTLGGGLPTAGGLGDITSTLGAGGTDVTGSLGGAGSSFSLGSDPLLSDSAVGAANTSEYGGASGGGGFLDKLGGGVVNSITKNPLGIATAGGLLGYDLLKGNPTDPNQKVLQQQAGQLASQGQQLQSYLTSGTLPPALQAQLNQATAAEKARIVSGYAARGQPTDPNQNSALAQELNNVDTNAIAAMAQTQIQMLNTGLQETGLSTQLYETLVKLDQGQNDQLMKAIASMAAAFGGGGGTTLKLAA
jgi:hypothetical protein